MKVDDKDGDITFSNGRWIRPNRGIIGINHKGEVFDGYDGYAEVYEAKGEAYDPEGTMDQTRWLDETEKRELAKEMIARWMKFGNLTSYDLL